MLVNTIHKTFQGPNSPLLNSNWTILFLYSRLNNYSMPVFPHRTPCKNINLISLFFFSDSFILIYSCYKGTSLVFHPRPVRDTSGIRTRLRFSVQDYAVSLTLASKTGFPFHIMNVVCRIVVVLCTALSPLFL